MRLPSWLLLLWMFALAHGAVAAESNAPPNPAIDMEGFLRVANETAAHRASRRLSEDEFIRMSHMPGTVILDARSKAMYDLLHIKGAINLSFPDIDVESLKKVLPDKNAKILIYCNNNFTPAPGVKNPGREVTPNGGVPVQNRNAEIARMAFRPKSAPASLNLSTQAALHQYGYRNVYELGPLVDPDKTKLELVSNKK